MKKRVLIFDDDADILEVCTIVLETSGFEVVALGSCEDVVGKVREASPDVVLLDNKIPPVGGISAARELKGSEEFGRLPIVFFSANQDVARLAVEAGADYFIEKPFDLDRLVGLITRACG
ncbi:MAG: response regulator [Bacteroidetes bacterium]|nr:response regulator [Bacteroidota bacterium]